MTNRFKAEFPTIISPDHKSEERKIRMKRISINVLVLLAMLITTAATPTASMAASDNFFAVLSGANEVPARDTNARGVATFKLSDDGTELSYRLVVANINNLVAAHIHVGSAGVNGPVVAFLYGHEGVPPGGGRIDGVVAEGTITAADLTGPLAGQPLSVLITAIEAGNTYVNAHTNDGVAPTNTGPGDFPGGEIRGQVQ